MKQLLIILTCYFLTNTISAQSWEEQNIYEEPNGTTGTSFGDAITVKDDILVVGASQDDYDDAENNYILNSGAAFIYAKDNIGEWVFQQKIVSPDRANNDRFGREIAISDDKMLIAVWEYWDDDVSNSLIDAGAVQVYKKNNSGNYIHHLKLTAPFREAFSYFGVGIVMSQNQLFIGSQEDDQSGTSVNGAGAVYVYNIDSNYNITLAQRLTQSNRNEGDRFGSKLSVSSGILVIGSGGNSYDENEMNFLEGAGAVYVFIRDVNTGLWSEHQKFVAINRYEYDGFGNRVAIFDNVIVVGVPGHDYDVDGNNFMNNSGAIYIFKELTNGFYSQIEKKVPITRSEDRTFGFTIRINNNHLVVGGLNFGTSQTDVFYSYKKNQTTGVYENEILGTSSVDTYGSFFGDDIQFTSDNSIVVTCLSCGPSNIGVFYEFNFNENLSVENQNKQQYIKVYPNPTQGLLHVKFETLQKNVEVKVLNVLGQTIFKTRQINTKSLNLNLKSSSGIYFIEIETNSGTYKEKILIE